jgi:hypothetical protein
MIQLELQLESLTAPARHSLSDLLKNYLVRTDAYLNYALLRNKNNLLTLEANRKKLLKLAGDSIALQIEHGIIDINDYKQRINK